ncbi:hexameric tyrosine-coordinated heme protein [Aliisedimentitalea scapharcae]|uniref:Hexameric tyrosine-coordinated heme protein n=1 Tax=Aliisedimentitalea scapharcae TaxID=1524259 RepID=A0ABZ2XQN7_9RHOB
MSWLPTLITDTPEQGYEIAIKMSRMAVKMTQPDDAARSKMRQDYSNNAESLIMSSHVVATNFQTVAQANDFWRR